MTLQGLIALADAGIKRMWLMDSVFEMALFDIMQRYGRWPEMGAQMIYVKNMKVIRQSART